MNRKATITLTVAYGAIAWAGAVAAGAIAYGLKLGEALNIEPSDGMSYTLAYTLAALSLAVVSILVSKKA
jgi:hypothetical protein